jgi:hypothetical protein
MRRLGADGGDGVRDPTHRDSRPPSAAAQCQTVASWVVVG